MFDLDLMEEAPVLETRSSTNSVREGTSLSCPSKDSQSTSSQDGLNVVEGLIEPPHVETTLPVNPESHAETTLPANPESHAETTLPANPESHSENLDLTHCFVTDQVFDSREALVNWCQEVAEMNNTVLAIRKTHKAAGGKGSYFFLACQRSGVYKGCEPKTDVKRRKPRGSIRCSCPFRLRCAWLEGDKWNVQVKCGTHNHEIPKTPTGSACKLKEEEKQLVMLLSTTGARPQEVLSALKEKNSENHSNIQAIYNIRNKLKLHPIGECSAMQQVMKLLKQYHYVEHHRRCEEKDEVTDLFWVHPECAKLAKCFPSVLTVDCTCKTNRFKMPLLHIVGITSTGLSFTVAFAFIEEETEEHYTWALLQLKSIYSPETLPYVFVTDKDSALTSAITMVFPGASRLLCTWQIDRDVQANCQKSFEKNDEGWKQFYNDWSLVWRAETKDEYGNAYADFVTKWALTYPTCIVYLRDTWLVHKERFVLAWTHKIKHFGNTTTSRESEHAKLKTYLGSSADSFITCWEAMHNLIKNEVVQIRASFRHSSTSVKRSHSLPALEELRNHVSHKALELIISEINRSENVGNDVSSCKCSLRTSHGLPCAHELAEYACEGRPIPLSEIDMHWKQLSVVPIQERNFRFDDLPEVQVLREKWKEASESERCQLVQKIRNL